MTNGDLEFVEATSTHKADLAECIADLAYIAEDTGWSADDPDEAQSELDHRELPPGGSPERDRIFLLSSGGRTVGYTKFYEGAPKSDTVFLGYLGIKKEHQRRGLARLALEQIESELCDKGFRTIRINVGTRNIPAMRFWISHGFTSIVGYSEAGEGFLDINLEKSLNDSQHGLGG